MESVDVEKELESGQGDIMTIITRARKRAG